MEAPRGLEQRGRWRAFRDPSVEAEFRAWHRDQIIPVARVVLILALVLWGSIPLLFILVVGSSPLVLFVGAWVIAVPVSLALLVAIHTKLARWANAIGTVAVLLVGLDFIWLQTAMFGRVYGSVSLAALAVVFIPVVVRFRTAGTAVITVVLCGVPAALQIAGTLNGQILLEQSWPYVSILLVVVPTVVCASAQIEASMRHQFVIEMQLEEGRRLIRRYVPSAVASRIEAGEGEAVGLPERRRVTALSSDVAGFTILADRLDPESLSHIVNEYVAAMSEVVEGEGGVITEFAGDGLMAIFGAPDQREPVEQVQQALAAASGMHAKLAELNQTWFHLGIEQPLKIRIGVNTGMLSVGTFGSDGRGTYTAIGLQMNIAARIQAECEPGSTLLSNSSWHLVKDEVSCAALGEVTVKGVHFPISVYSPGQAL